MTLITTIIDGIAPLAGLGGANEGHINGFMTDLVSGSAGGVVDKDGGHCLVHQVGTPSMHVVIDDGIVYVPNANYDEFVATDTKLWRVVVLNESNAPIGANSSGSTRIDLICVYVDKTVESNEYGSNVASIEVVQGTPGAGVPATPDDHYVLAQVEVINGATSITNAKITDTRSQIYLDLIKLPYVDEDNMVSNSASLLPTQQSVKAYVDSNTGVNKNYIMNGNFDVWQRGTSVALTDSTITFLADRWADYPSKDGGTLPTLTRSRQLITSGDLFNAFYHSRLATNGAGTSLGTNSFHFYYQKIEHGTRYLCGDSKKVTLSFWARSNIVNKKLGVYLQQDYGTTGSPTSIETINGTNWTLTSTWTKYTHTFTTNTLANKTFGTDNNDNLRLGFSLMWGTGYQARVGASGAETYVGGGYVDIAQVQLCAGDVALPFMPKSFEEELRECQRYYEKSFNYATAPADAASMLGSIYLATQSTSSYHNFGLTRFMVEKRTTPTVTFYNPVASSSDEARNTTDNTNHPISAGNIGSTGFVAYINNSSIAATKGLVSQWTAESEL